MHNLNSSYQFESVDNRKLSGLEHGLELYNKNTGTWNTLFISRIKGKLNEGVVREALVFLQSRHMRLKSRIVGSPDNLRYETDETLKIPLRAINDVERWQDVVEEELNKKIESDKSLMRVTLICSDDENDIGYILLSIHHVIIDGVSAAKLFQELLTYMGKIASGEEVILEPSVTTLPNTENLLPDSVKGFSGVINRISYLVRYQLKMLWYRPRHLDFEKSVPAELKRNGFIQKELDRAFIEKLRVACKKRNCGLNGALSAAMLFSIANRISAGELKKLNLRLSSAVDLRSRLIPAVDKEKLGVIATFLVTFHTLRKGWSFWQLANDVSRKLNASLKTNDMFTIALLFRQFVKLTLKFPKLGAAVAISILGLIKIPKVYGPYTIESFSSALSVSATDGVFFASIPIFDRKITMNFTFSEPSISRETAGEIADNIVFYLSEVCEKDDIYFS